MGNINRTKLYVENADFQKGLGAPICGWQSYYGKRKPQGSQIITQDESYSGSKCLKISEQGMVYSDTVLGIKAGYTYTASAMIKVENEAEFMVKFYDISTAEFFTETVTVPAEKGWKYVEVSAAAPSGAVFARVLINAKNEGNVYVDDVNVYEEPFLKYLNNINIMSEIQYVICADCVNSGEITLEFKDDKSITLAQVKKSFSKNEKAQVKAYAPKNAEKLAIKTGENCFKNLEVFPVAYGTQVPDRKFETLKNDVPSVWEKIGTKLVSSSVPVESGKSYAIVCNVKSKKAGSGKITITYYNFKGELIEDGKATVISKGIGEEKLRIDSIAPSFAYYAFIELDGTDETEFKEVEFYTISNSVSNASFESINQHCSYNPLLGEDGAMKAGGKEEAFNEVVKPRGKNGNFPLGWRKCGDIFAIPVCDDELDSKFGATRLRVYGIGEGSIYSSMICIDSGKSYTAGILAKGQSGGLRLAFFDSDFNFLAKSDIVSFCSDNYKKYTTTGISPKGAVYAALELAAIAGDSFSVDYAEFYPSVLDVKNRTQMFIDDYLIDSTDMVRAFHTPEKTEPIMGESEDYWEKHGAYVYGTILYDKDDKLYKMWYQATNHDDISGGDATSVMAAYATSVDAVNWEKPSLGIMEYPVSAERDKTSKENNLIGNAHMHNMSVFIDYDDVPEKKFKMITYNKEPVPGKRLGRGYYIWRYSADGVNWHDGGIVTKGLDVITAAPASGSNKYYGVLKNVQTRRDQWTVVGNAIDSWDVPVPAKSLADIIDAKNYFRADSYGMGLYHKDGVYIGINWLMDIPGKATYEGKIVPMLAFSRDLKEEWQRPTREPIIPLGDWGSIDCGQIYTASYAMEMGDEVWVYCGVWNDDHLVHDREARIYIAKWRMDGFASLNSGKEECTLKTKPIALFGSKLCINANAACGSIYVELLNDEGKPISGFTKADCDKINGDSTKYIVSWNGNRDISSLKGKIVSLKIYAKESELYSLKFEE